MVNNNQPLAQTQSKCPIKTKPSWVFQFLFVALLGIALLAVGYVIAPSITQQQFTTTHLLSNVTYERTFLAFAVSIFLMIPAYWLFILQNRQGPTTLWRAFWTMSYVAYITYLYWGTRLLLEEKGMAINIWNWSNLEQALLDSPNLLSNRSFDTLLALWWTLDVFIAWLPGKFNGLATPNPVSLSDSTPKVEQPSPPSFVRSERKWLCFVLYIAWIVASIPQGHGLVRVLGYTFAIVTLLAFLVRVVIRPFDAKSLSGILYTRGFALLNYFFKWYELPTWFGIINLGALRETLRAKNLYGTDHIPVTNRDGLIKPEGEGLIKPDKPFNLRDLVERRDDGCYNDLKKPNMGRGSKTTDPSNDSMLHDRSHPCARFGRNVPLKDAFPDDKNLLVPNPREISRELLSRGEFIRASTLNLIAAAWIQFQTHDWFNHGEPERTNNIDIPLTGEKIISVKRTRPDPTRDYDKERHLSPDGKLQNPPTYVNAESHWWDASQIYGNDDKACKLLRTDPDTDKLVPKGKLYIDPDGNIHYNPSDPEGLATSGFVGNWWLGLSLLHAIFVKEHNAICDHLAQAYPMLSDDELFAKARMINAALIAKIHTVEWTTALLQNPALQIGMKANWWGLFTESFTKTFGRISPTEAFSGIPNSGVDHHKVDYTLTEEFVSVYRLHPLMPDELKLLNLQDGKLLQRFDLTEKNGIDGIIGSQRDLIHPGHERVQIPSSMPPQEWQNNLWYSFGIANPGALTLHNYPNYMRDLARETPGRTVDGKRELIKETIDLATIDILRDRERGVPRYNRFRELFHLKPITSFNELGNDPNHPEIPEQLRAIYGQTNGKDNVDALDLMVGMFAEAKPEGFGISDTAFRVFILMASRRIKSDRFMAEGFNANVFTPEGIAWVNDNSMLSILRRHHPELAPALYGLENAFVPWRDLSEIRIRERICALA